MTAPPLWRRIAAIPVAWFWDALLLCLPYPRFSPVTNRLVLLVYSRACGWGEYVAGRMPGGRDAR